MRNWYALHCRSNAEKLVVDRLTGFGIEAFYPHILTRSRDGRRDVDRKFFAGYAFACFDFERDRHHVAELPQIARILGWTPLDPAPIPESEIDAVRLLMTAPPKQITEAGYVSKGDRVRVLWGPLTGLEGLVEYRKRVRVAVNVTMLGRSLSAEVDANSLELIARALPMAA